jgi:hypothetical protein
MQIVEANYKYFICVYLRLSMQMLLLYSCNSRNSRLPEEFHAKGI